MILEFLDDRATLIGLFPKNYGCEVDFPQEAGDGLARFSCMAVDDKNLASGSSWFNDGRSGGRRIVRFQFRDLALKRSDRTTQESYGLSLTFGEVLPRVERVLKS